MLELLMYPPVWRGLIILIIGGAVFPISGVYIVRMNLLPIRFMMMHAVMLGGGIALALNISPIGVIAAVNVIMVFFLVYISRNSGVDMGQVSLFLMILSIGIASILIYTFHVPAKDTMSLLWGSPFAAGKEDFISLIILGLVLLFYQIFFSKQLRAIFFDKSVAYTSGVNEALHTYIVVCITALAVASAIRLMGALLMDALILLPAIIASSGSRSMKGVFVRASIWGIFLSVTGFFTALAFDLPVSGSIAVLAAVFLALIFLLRRKK